MTTSSFIHRFIPAAKQDGAPTLVLLHGTGGDESDLLPLGELVSPDSALLSPRGQVSEGGAPRFFRRLAPGVFDVPDLIHRTGELAQFITDSATTYGFPANDVIAAGFSNGANIAASMLLLHPGVLRGAILLSPMIPLIPDVLPDLAGTPVFIGAGRQDAMVPAAQTQQLADLLTSAGASVTLHWENGGHTLTRSEIDAAARWMAGLKG